MSIEQQIEEAQYRIKYLQDNKQMATAKTMSNLLSIISQQSADIERLKRINEIAIDALNNISGHYMDYIENNIECDTAATRMDNTVDNALAVIGALTPVGGESPC